MRLSDEKQEQLAAHKRALDTMSADERESLVALLRKLDDRPDVGPEMALDILGSIALYCAKNDVRRV